MKPRLTLVISLLILLAAVFLVTRRHRGQAEVPSATGGGQSGGARGVPTDPPSSGWRRARVREEGPVSDELAAETGRLFLERLDWDASHSPQAWQENVGVVQDVILRMNAAQLEQLIRTLAASGRKIGSDEMNWDDFPLVRLAELNPMAAVSLYAELWPEGGSPGPQMRSMLQTAAEKDPQAVASWVRGQAGRSDAKQLLEIRTEVLQGILARDVKLSFSLMPQVGVTDYRQAAQNLVPWERSEPGKFLPAMHDFAATLPPEDAAALRQGTMQGIASQICSNGDSGIDTQMERWPLEPEETTAVVEALVTQTRDEFLMPWLTGDSRTPFVQAVRRLYLEQHPVNPLGRTERIRAALGE